MNCVDRHIQKACKAGPLSVLNNEPFGDKEFIMSALDRPTSVNISSGENAIATFSSQLELSALTTRMDTAKM